MVPNEENSVLPKVPHKGILQQSLNETRRNVKIIAGDAVTDVIPVLAFTSELVVCQK